MAQYISVYMDDEKCNYENKGLYDIIAFIGKKTYNGKKCLSIHDAYKKGKRVINSKLKKWHSTTIERLVIADKKRYAFNYTETTSKPVWKIHKNKAQKVFSVIYFILKKYNDSDILKLFNSICKMNGFNSGAEVAGAPYYRVIKDKTLLVCQTYNNEEVKILKKCARKIEKFSKFK